MNIERMPSKPVLYLRAVLFWVAFNFSVVFHGTLVVLAWPLPGNASLKVAKVWSRFNLLALKLICKIDYEVQGAEHITGQNAIVFCKHQSTWETIALHNIIPYGRWVFKRQLLFIPFFGWALAATDPIAIDRSAGRAAVNQLVNKGTKKLESGQWIIIFPEGTRTAPGPSNHYKIGGAVLAAKSGYPVLPIAHNAGEFWPRRSAIKRPGTIQVRIGPMIETRGKEPKQVLEEARDWIEGAMREISNPALY